MNHKKIHVIVFIWDDKLGFKTRGIVVPRVLLNQRYITTFMNRKKPSPLDVRVIAKMVMSLNNPPHPSFLGISRKKIPKMLLLVL